MGSRIGSPGIALRGEGEWSAPPRAPWDVRTLVVPELRSGGPGLLALRIVTGRIGARGLADVPSRRTPQDDARLTLVRLGEPGPRSRPFSPDRELDEGVPGLRLTGETPLELTGAWPEYRVLLAWPDPELELELRLECGAVRGLRLGRLLRAERMAATVRGWLRDGAGRRAVEGPALLSRSRGRDLRRVHREWLWPTGGLHRERGVFPGLGTLDLASWRLRRWSPGRLGIWTDEDGTATVLTDWRTDALARRVVPDRCLGETELATRWRGEARAEGLRLEWETREAGPAGCPEGQLTLTAAPARFRLRRGAEPALEAEGGIYRESLESPRKGRRHGI